jgi:selenide,water dikinase
VLWDNIVRTLSGAPLRRYVPQRDFLKLLNTGDGRAIGEWRGLSVEGAWCWWLKDRIDSRFIQQYRPTVVPAVTRS